MCTIKKQHHAETVVTLTKGELEMIKACREKDRREAEERGARRKALRLAADYEAWLQDNGRGSTFSTFANEFDYDEHDASEVFKRVEKIRAASRREA